MALLRNSSTQDLSPKECTLGLLDHLLIYGLRWMVHHDGTSLVVDLRVDSGVTDQIHDPFLTFGRGETEAGGEISVL